MHLTMHSCKSNNVITAAVADDDDDYVNDDRAINEDTYE